MKVRNHSEVALVVPGWIEEEVRYAYDKYGASNPQHIAMRSGLHEGGLAYMDFMNYINKFRIYLPEAPKEEAFALRASQAVLKFVNVGTAQVCLFSQLRKSTETMIDAYNSEVKNWIATVVPKIDPTDPQDPIDYALGTLHTNLLSLAAMIDDNDMIASETKAKQIFLGNAQFAIAHVATLGIIAAPGFSSGDARPWQIAV